jgi:hypothetical protein
MSPKAPPMPGYWHGERGMMYANIYYNGILELEPFSFVKRSDLELM